MLNPKALNFELDTTGLSIHQVNSVFEQTFIRKDFDWWYEVLPGDVVVDIGAHIGLFAAASLDKGADKVYMIEPNRDLLKVAIKNVSDYIIDHTIQKVIPINAAVGKVDMDSANIFRSAIVQEKFEEPRLISLLQLCEEQQLKQIDFLKVDVSGAEYNILTADNIEFLSNNVRHIAVRCYLDGQYGGEDKFSKWRENFLLPFAKKNKVNWQNEQVGKGILSDSWKETIANNRVFMIYITNW